MSSDAPATATDHAQQRFQQRVATQQPDYLGVGVRHLLAEAVPVGLTHKTGRAKLHPPSGAVLVCNADATAIKTVYHADQVELNDDHLVTCDGCGLRFDRGRDAACPWCRMGADAVADGGHDGN